MTDSPNLTIAQNNQEADYRKLVCEDLSYQSYIRKMCNWGFVRKIKPALERTHQSHMDADDLYQDILQHLAKKLENSKFEGRSAFNTFLNAIIANKIIDIKREIEGRNRTEERDEKPTTVNVEAESYHQGIRLDVYQDEETGEISQPDTSRSPEVMVVKIESRELLEKVVSRLRGEEHLIFRMAYPLNEDEIPKEKKEIARIFKTTEKAVDSKLRRIVARCREMMQRQGITLEDLLT